MCTLLEVAPAERRGLYVVEQDEQPSSFRALGRGERRPRTLMQNHFAGWHRREALAVFQTLFRFAQADAAARLDVRVALREFALIRGIIGAQ